MTGRKRSSDSSPGMISIKKRLFNFFKIFCLQTCSEKMEIPISKLEFDRRVMPNLVTLRNPLLKVWSTEIIETGDGIFFQNGWSKFVEDNSVINGDKLTFSYAGDGVFDVIVLDSWGCDKIAVAGAQAQLTSLKENDKKEEEVEGAKDGGVNDKHHARSKDKNQHNTSGSKRDANVEKSDIPEHFGADLFKSGHYIQPKDAYFVTKITKKMQDDLHIPTEVIKDFNIQLPPTVILRDPRGREWITKVNVKGGRKTWLTEGWRSLCLVNGVEIEDRCICEFMPQSGTDMILQVTIVQG